MNTARQTLGGTAANNTSGLACGGDAPPGSPSYSVATELFTGAGQDIGAWATATSMNTARYALASANKGTRTSALAFSGGFPNKNETENYDGTTWAEVNNLNTARRSGAGAGTATSALCFAGDTGPPNPGITTKPFLE